MSHTVEDLRALQAKTLSVRLTKTVAVTRLKSCFCVRVNTMSKIIDILGCLSYV